MNISHQVVDGHLCEKSEESTGKKFSFIVVVRFIRIFRWVEISKAIDLNCFYFLSDL